MSWRLKGREGDAAPHRRRPQPPTRPSSWPGSGAFPSPNRPHASAGFRLFNRRLGFINAKIAEPLLPPSVVQKIQTPRQLSKPIKRGTFSSSEETALLEG